jgi:molybdenum cofactor biosynthesis enzyme
MVSLLGLVKLSEDELDKIRIALLDSGNFAQASAVAGVLIAKQRKRLRGK